jgi:hypothetical protein
MTRLVNAPGKRTLYYYWHRDAWRYDRFHHRRY